jgi:integrase
MNELATVPANALMLAHIQSIQDNYTPQIAAWVSWMDETGNKIDGNGIRAYFRDLLKSNYAASTIRIKRQAVKCRMKQFFHDADDRVRADLDRLLKDLDHEHDTKAPKVQPVPIQDSKVLKPSDYLLALNKCRSKRQVCYMRFLFETGARVSEMTGARLDRCKVDGPMVNIRVLGKGSKERILRLPVETYSMILSTFKGSVYLFETSGGKPYQRTYISEQVTTIGKRIGRRISAHTMRHSYATKLVTTYPDKLDAISRSLGHSNVSITLGMYVHTTLTDDELRHAICA